MPRGCILLFGWLGSKLIRGAESQLSPNICQSSTLFRVTQSDCLSIHTNSKWEINKRSNKAVKTTLLDEYYLTAAERPYMSSMICGIQGKYSILKKWQLSLLSIFSRPIRETRELLPRYAVDNIFVSDKFKQRSTEFEITTYRDGLTTTLKEWRRYLIPRSLGVKLSATTNTRFGEEQTLKLLNLDSVREIAPHRVDAFYLIPLRISTISRVFSSTLMTLPSTLIVTKSRSLSR